MRNCPLWMVAWAVLLVGYVRPGMGQSPDVRRNAPHSLPVTRADPSGRQPIEMPGSRFRVDWQGLVSGYDITLSSPAGDSYRGLLLGNGDIAASLYGPPELLTLHVGKNDLWDYRDSMDEKRAVSHAEFLRKYADPEKPAVANYIWDPKADARNVEIRKTYGDPMPSIKPAGQIRFRGKPGVGAGLESRLDLWNAEATADLGPGKASLRSYVSYRRNLVVVDYDPRGPAQFDIELARHKDSTGVIPTSPEFGADGSDLWVRYRFPADPANYPDGFEYAMYGRVIGGDRVQSETIPEFAVITQARWREGQVATDKVKAVEGVAVAHVRASGPVTLLVAVATTRDDPRPFERAKHEVDEASRAGSAALEGEHRAFWHGYWQRSFVRLPGKPFLNQVWYFSQYLLASSWRAGRVAPGLFGAWTWEDFPLFGNDYHWDYNMQQAVWGAYSSNHLEQAVAYNEAALQLLPTAIADARDTYGIEGAKFFLSSYPRKYSRNPFPLLHYDKMMSLNGWVAHPVWWYYLYSQDREFLRRAYPLLRECARFYERYLTRAEDGRYDIWPTVAWDVDFSPHLKLNRNFPMDLSFVRYVLKAAAQAGEILSVDDGERTAWLAIAENLREYPTAETPSGKVFTAFPGATSGYHFPLAAMMVFPCDDIGLASPPEIQARARRTVAPMTYSGDEQLLKGVIRARLGIDDSAAFEEQLRSTVRANGTLAYGGQWFFWVHGAGNSLWHNENLMQSHDGRIRVAPVKLESGGQFATLRTAGAFLVSGEIRPGGVVAWLAITSEAGRSCTLVNPWDGPIRIRRFPSLEPVATVSHDGAVTFATEKGATYIIDTTSSPWERQPLGVVGRDRE